MTGTADRESIGPSRTSVYRWPAPATETHGRTRFLEVFLCMVALVAIGGVQLVPALLFASASYGPLVTVAALAVVVVGAVLVGRFKPWRWFARARPAPDGETRGVLGRTVGRHAPVLGVIALGGAILLAVFLRIGASAGRIIAVSVADAALVVWATRIVWQGGVAVRWLPETLVAGGRATFYVETTRGGSRLAGCEVMLRCVTPCDPGVPVAACPTRRVVRWSEVRAPDHDPGPEEPVIVTFDVPADAPPAIRPVEWDLVVQGHTMWGRVRESFLVPVGTCPPAPVAAGAERSTEP